VEAPGRTLGQASPKGLHSSPNVVHQLRTATDQCLPGADYGQVSLALFTSVLERIEQLRIHSSQASQILGVDLICFAFVGVDKPQLSGIGHQDLVATLLLEQTAYPGRVGSSLDGYAQRPLLGGEASSEGFGGCAQPTLLDHLAAYRVDEAQVGILVAEVQSGSHLWLFAATIHGGPILLSGPLEPVEHLQTQRVLRIRGSAFSSHLPRTPPYHYVSRSGTYPG
jgi:hypothetical protein